jgi:hypothetical protein
MQFTQIQYTLEPIFATFLRGTSLNIKICLLFIKVFLYKGGIRTKPLPLGHWAYGNDFRYCTVTTEGPANDHDPGLGNICTPN